MPKDEFDSLPVIDVPESEKITVAVKSLTMWLKVTLPTPKSTPLRLRYAAVRALTTRACPSAKCSSGVAISGLGTVRRSGCLS